ncbi:MAG: EFR1 family ferrodoxin [Clostridia bacterium]|nr:EFR1 family ferrodoxin [Clostridia bacterium]
MNCLVCYFSPTKNTENVVRIIIEKAKHTYEDIDVNNTTIIENRYKDIPYVKHYDLLIVSFPVYSQRMPKIFSEYLFSQHINCDKALIVTTYGGVTIGNALEDCSAKLLKLGIKTYGAISVPEKHSYASAFEKYEYYNIAQEEKKKILENFFDKCQENLEKNKPISLRRKTDAAVFFSQRFISRLTVCIPKVNLSKCVRCKKCIKSCPVNAIDENLVINSKECIRCCACVNVCEFDARKCEIKNIISKKIIRKGMNLEKMNDFRIFI